MAIKIAINGANGRMGQEIRKIIDSDSAFELVALYDVTIPISLQATKKAPADVLIDFSSEFGLKEVLKSVDCKIVSGTTGLSEETFTLMRKYGEEKNGIIWGSNVSFGMNLMFAMVKKLGEFLADDEYDAEVYERHHRMKKDAPSGSALTIGKKIAEGRRANFIQRDYGTQGERKIGEIGFAVERGGKTVGFHEVAFISNDERIWFGHEAFDRSIFAKGAVKLAKIAHMHNISGFHESCDVLSNIL